MKTYLGLDVGTSSVKAVLVDAVGTVLGQGSSGYDTRRGPGGIAEQDAEDYLRAGTEAIAECGSAGELAGIGLAGQTPTLVLCAADGAPTRPVLTWQDQRAVAEADALADALGDPFDQIGTSLPWSPSAVPAKLAWLATHEPDVLRASRWALQPKDYVGLAMAGSPASDPWSSKGLCHVATFEPCFEVLSQAGVDARLVPPIGGPWESRGSISPAAAARFGVPAGVPVTVGWSDALAGMLAVGAFDEPATFALTGTSDIVGITLPDGPPTAGALYSVPSTCAPMTIIYGPTSTSGASLVWLAELLGSTAGELLDLAIGSEPHRPVPVFLPYLDGERAPVWRHDVAASFAGLRHDTTRADLARAVLTGVACSERHVVQTALQVTGRRVVPRLLTGGRASTHQAWQNARSSVFGCEVHAFDNDLLTATGAAALAAAEGTAAGAVAAARRMRTAPVVAPAPSQASTAYERYLAESDHAVSTAAR